MRGCRIQESSKSVDLLEGPVGGPGGRLGPQGGATLWKKEWGIPRAAAPNIMGNIKGLLKESCSNPIMFPIMFGLAAPRISHNVPPPPGLPRASLDPLRASWSPGGTSRGHGPRFALCFALAPQTRGINKQTRKKNSKCNLYAGSDDSYLLCDDPRNQKQCTPKMWPHTSSH